MPPRRPTVRCSSKVNGVCVSSSKITRKAQAEEATKLVFGTSFWPGVHDRDHAQSTSLGALWILLPDGSSIPRGSRVYK